MTWILSEPLESIFIQAEDDGLYIRSNAPISWIHNPNFPIALTPLGKSLPILIPQLIELGYAELASDENSIHIPYSHFVFFNEREITDFDKLILDAPFTIALNTKGALGQSDFSYSISFFYGQSSVSIERKGCFAKFRNKYYQFDAQTYQLLSEIDRFRKLTPEEKKSNDCLISFEKISDLSDEIGAQVDKFIINNKVMLPSKLGIDLIHELDDRISFCPFVEGIQREVLRKAFFSAEDVSSLFFDDENGIRVRLIFTKVQQEAVQRMTQVRHLGGAEKVSVLSNPSAIFDGLLDAIYFDIGEFGPRVKGIGEFPFASIPTIRGFTTEVLDSSYSEQDKEKNNASNLSKTAKTILMPEISWHFSDGSTETLELTREELLKINQDVQIAFSSGKSTVKLGDKEILINRDFSEQLKEMTHDVISFSKSGNLDLNQGKKYLLIHKNDISVDYQEGSSFSGSIDHKKMFLPTSLNDSSQLKPHQKEGIMWLQRHFLSGRRGALLADDMGLGKTVQVLTFIAWLIESGYIVSQESSNPEKAPWNPILVVMPAVLLENETWIKDIQEFFKDQGSIFDPYLILHKQGLDKMRSFEKGSETILQKPVLNLDALRQYRIIFTNYETVVNYQFSFASMKSDWSMIVTDEAQKHKTPSAKISHALKSCSPRFRIACTGTPVETRLLDVWNIMDYLQPGHLKSANEFTKEFEQPIQDNPQDTELILDDLRRKLLYDIPQQSFILRRDKAKTITLPNKKIHKEKCDLSPIQRELHAAFMAGGTHPLAIIDSLLKLTQHPDLINGSMDDSDNVEQLLARCPKLAKCLELLGKIKDKKEKGLIFTRSIKMQELLKKVIFYKFRQHIDIVNGDGSHNTETSKKTRNMMIEEFKKSSAINFIILSPDVAGMGLNLVEANHVIHYGRWWNPAKESQATDRVYRMKQKKEVHVYYLIAHDPKGEFVSFDEKLDALIERRTQMASSFLVSFPSDEDLKNDLFNELFSKSESIKNSGTTFKEAEIMGLSWDKFEALVATLEEKKGRAVILTPKSGDYGFDVISIQGNLAFLIQCKHSTGTFEQDESVIEEIRTGVDVYRMKFFQKSVSLQLRPMLVTNKPINKKIKKMYQDYEIEVISKSDFTGFLEKYPLSWSEIAAMEQRRVRSIKDMKSHLEILLK